MFFIFTPKIGEDEPILTNIFQMGWNHQLVKNGPFSLSTGSQLTTFLKLLENPALKPSEKNSCRDLHWILAP